MTGAHRALAARDLGEAGGEHLEGGGVELLYDIVGLPPERREPATASDCKQQSAIPTVTAQSKHSHSTVTVNRPQHRIVSNNQQSDKQMGAGTK